MTEPHAPSAANALRNAFWVAFDHLGAVIRLNALFLLCCIPLVTIPAAAAGLMHSTRMLIETGDSGAADFFNGIRRFGVRYTVFYGGLILILGAAASSAAFYLYEPTFLRMTLFGWDLAGMILLILCALYSPTVLLLKKRPAGCLKMPFVFTFANTSFTISAFFMGVCTEAVFILSGISIVLWMFPFMALYYHFVYIEAASRFDGQPPRYTEDRSVAKEFLIPPHNNY
ncbi:MAG TPA: hypothetical protein P5287_01815 [bacterium]|nr:hypothetical protein [bacterium]